MAVVNSSRFNAKEATDWGIAKFCEAYHGEIIEALDEVLPEVAKEAVKKLKADSPKLKGKYAKGWTFSKNKGRYSTGVVIYGKTGTYQLAHLLEKGHAKRGGGRTQPILHIAPVDEWLNEEAVNRIIERLK